MKNKNFTAIMAIAAVLILVLIGGTAALLLGRNKKNRDVKPTESIMVSASVEKTEPTEEKKPESTEILDEFKSLVSENPDMVGWIKLHNSRVDYPVMFAPNEEFDYYERRNFQKQNDVYGVPFIDINCTLDSDNYLIYGHETDNGTQFHDFLQYESKDFWEKNKTFEFATLYGKYNYEVVAFSRSRIFNVDDKVFKYYKFYGSSNEAEFDDYIRNIKNIQLYDTGVEAKYGDHLLTLSMCVTPYHDPNDERFVLVARRADKISE